VKPTGKGKEPMSKTQTENDTRTGPDAAEGPAALPPAARRALAEAEARRKAARAAELPPEIGGRDGPEPVRYGDWERKGICVDF